MSKAATIHHQRRHGRGEAAENDGRLVRVPLPDGARWPAKKNEDDKQASFHGCPRPPKATHDMDRGDARRADEEQATIEVDRAIQKGALVLAEARYTTPQAQAIERSILAIERDGRGALQPILSDEGLAARLAASDLNQGQREAVEMILGTTNRFVAVQGYAGTGKSHMLERTINEITQDATQQSLAAGFDVVGLAPYGTQVAALPEQAWSPTRWPASQPAGGAGGPGEKSSCSWTRPASCPYRWEAMRIVEKAGARMVMLGDRKQTGAVEAGKPFAQLQDAGMLQAQLREIQRQRNPEIKAAVLNAANDQTNKAVTRLLGSIREVPEEQDRYQAIASDFTALSPQEREATLIVAGTNEARHSINEMVRKRMRLEGGLKYTVLERGRHAPSSSSRPPTRIWW
jgi:hypothetical protein